MKKISSTTGQLCLSEAVTTQIQELQCSYAGLLKERLEEYGVDSLMDAEVLSLLTGIPVDILKKTIDDFGLLDIGKYFDSVDMTKVQRRKIELLTLYHRRMLLASHKQKVTLNSSAAAGDFIKTLFIDRAYECFCLICLDSQNRVNKAVTVHEGTISESPVYPRLIVEQSLRYRANSVIIAHNHPGGSLTPSSADLDVTKRIQNALGAINIPVVDHFIISENRYFSFAEGGLMAKGLVS